MVLTPGDPFSCLGRLSSSCSWILPSASWLLCLHPNTPGPDPSLGTLFAGSGNWTHFSCTCIWLIGVAFPHLTNVHKLYLQARDCCKYLYEVAVRIPHSMSTADQYLGCTNNALDQANKQLREAWVDSSRRVAGGALSAARHVVETGQALSKTSLFLNRFIVSRSIVFRPFLFLLPFPLSDHHKIVSRSLLVPSE